MEIDLHKFGARVQALRLSLGMTQQELASQAALSAHYIGNLEQGVKCPSIETVFRLCCALGTTSNTLFEDSLSDDMLSGIPKQAPDTITFRDTTMPFTSLLSNFLSGFNEEDNACTLLDHPDHAPSTLTDLLFEYFDAPEADDPL